MSFPLFQTPNQLDRSAISDTELPPSLPPPPPAAAAAAVDESVLSASSTVSSRHKNRSCRLFRKEEKNTCRKKKHIQQLIKSFSHIGVKCVLLKTIEKHKISCLWIPLGSSSIPQNNSWVCSVFCCILLLCNNFVLLQQSATRREGETSDTDEEDEFGYTWSKSAVLAH